MTYEDLPEGIKRDLTPEQFARTPGKERLIEGMLTPNLEDDEFDVNEMGYWSRKQ